ITVHVAETADATKAAEQTFTVTVADQNSAPVLDPISDRLIAEGSALTFTATATDSDVPANTLTFSLVGAPAGAAIDPATGAFTGRRGEARGPEPYPLRVRGPEDGNPPLFGEQSLTVIVTEVNQPPTLAPIPDQRGAEGATLTVTASASDPDL